MHLLKRDPYGNRIQRFALGMSSGGLDWVGALTMYHRRPPGMYRQNCIINKQDLLAFVLKAQSQCYNLNPLCE